MSDVILRVNNLKKYFPVKTGFFSRTVAHVRAVDGISLEIRRGETLGLVGESASGKTTLGRTILRLIEPTAGEIFFEEKNLRELKSQELKKIRKYIQMVFQDPYSSLDPRMKIRDILLEPVIAQGYDKHEFEGRMLELLKIVGLDASHLYRFPHEFSGGQQQRIAIARALMLNPHLLILDEPTSKIDMCVQAGILNLLRKIQLELKLSYLFISHNLRVISHMSDRVAVMYAGNLVETAKTEQIFNHPSHPYTIALFAAIPIPNPDQKREKLLLTGDVPNLVNPPTGCRFHPRCFKARSECKVQPPELTEIRKGQFVACYFPD